MNREKNQPSAGVTADSVKPGAPERAALIALGFMASLPFLQPFHNLPLPSFQSEWLAMLLGLLGFMAVVRCAGGALRIPPVAAIAPLLGLIIILQLLCAMFAYPVSAAIILLYLAWGALLAVAGRTLAYRIGEQAVISVLAWFLLVGGLLNAVFGLLQYFGVAQDFGGLVTQPMALSIHGVYGNLAQQNHFSTHLALALTSTLYLCFAKRLSVTWCGVWAGLLLAALVLSGSRSAFLHLGWISLLSLRLFGRSLATRLPRRLIWGAIAVAATLMLAIWMVAHFAAVPQFARLVHFSAAFGPRFFLWQQAWAMFLGHPWLGVGFDDFAAQLVDQLGNDRMRNPWGVDQYAHNIFLQLLAVSGIAGLLAFAVPALCFLWRQLHLNLTAERLWLWGGLGVLAIHSMVEQPLYYSYFLGLATLMAGIADPSALGCRLQGMGRVAVNVACVGFALLLAKTASDYDQLQGQFFSERYSSDAEEVKLKLLHQIHDYSLLSPLTELVAPALFSPVQSSAKEKIAFNVRVMHYAPTAENEFRHTVLLADAGQIEQAMQQFDRSAYAYPDDVEQYAARFALLEARDPIRYAALAAHVRSFIDATR